MWLATTRVTAGGGAPGVQGKWWYTPPGSTADFREASLPDGVTAVAVRPSFADYTGDGKSRVYACGAFCDNLVFTENCQLLRQGIVAPINPFAAGAGSGISIGVAAAAATGTGRTGSCVCYIAWYDQKHDRRSPLSGASAAVVLAGQGILWTNLPAAPIDGDPSVTHIELWVSMDGETARLSARRDVGATTATEETPTLELGLAYDEDFGRFPVCQYNTSWHDRQVLAGDKRFPDRIYFSVLLEYERYANFYLRTRRGERVTALYVVRDNLFVTTDKSHYIVTGYTEDDIEMHIFEPALGCCSHHGVANIGEYALVPSNTGMLLNIGESLQNVSQGFASTWRREYESYKEEFEDGFAVCDPQYGVYKFCPGQTGVGGSVLKYWVLDYGGIVGSPGGSFSSPQLMYDYRERLDTCAANLAYPNGRRSDVFTGSNDGFIRLEGVTTDTDDDSDDYGKDMEIRLKHYFFEEPGGNDSDAFLYPTFWVFMRSEHEEWTMRLFVGDESANDADAEQAEFSETIPASAAYVDDATHRHFYRANTRHFTEPNVAGNGVTLLIEVESPTPGDHMNTTPARPITDGVVWAGFGCTRIPGENQRGIVASQALAP